MGKAMSPEPPRSSALMDALLTQQERIAKFARDERSGWSPPIPRTMSCRNCGAPKWAGRACKYCEGDLDAKS